MFKKKLFSPYVSVSRNFVIVAVATIFIVVFSIVFFTLKFYDSEISKKNTMLPSYANHVSLEITESFDYIVSYAEYIGEQIIAHNHNDLNYIAGLMAGNFGSMPNQQNLYISTLFDWVKPDKKMWVSSSKGVFKNPIDMSHRTYLDYTEKYPWTLQVQDPAVGIPSGQWIIPAGYGVTDKKGKYVGAVTLGFAIDGLANKLDSLFGNGEISYAVITLNGNFVVGSGYRSMVDGAAVFKDAMASGLIPGEKTHGKLDKPVLFGGVEYSYYYKVSKYPYIVLTGFNKEAFVSFYYKSILPRIIETIIIGLALVVMLIIVRRQVIVPLVSLSNAADAIAKGEMVTKFPRVNSVEAHNIVLQLINVMRLLKKQNRHQEQLTKAKEQIEDAYKIVRESKAAKDDFVKKARSNLRVPVNAIKSCAEAMLHEEYGKLPEKYKELINIINESTEQLVNCTTNMLNIAKVNVKKAIEQSVVVHKDEAFTRNIKLSVSVPDEIPNLLADEIRIKQIIVGTIYQSLLYTPDGGEIKLTANLVRNKVSRDNLVIIIEDNGYGIDEKMRSGVTDTLDSKAAVRNLDGIDISINYIRSLVELHEGNFIVESMPQRGTSFIIELPYREEV